MGEAKRRRDGGAPPPPPRSELEMMLRLGEAHIHEILMVKREKALMPIFHLATPEGHVVIACPWNSPTEKQITLAAVKAKAHAMKATCGMFVGEAWMMQVNTEHLDSWHVDRAIEKVWPPSEQPGRIEVVQIMATDGRTNAGKMWQMVRDKPGGRLISLVEMTSSPEATISGAFVDGLIRPHDDA